MMRANRRFRMIIVERKDMDNLSGQEVRAIQATTILRQPLHKFIAAKRRERSVQWGAMWSRSSRRTLVGPMMQVCDRIHGKSEMPPSQDRAICHAALCVARFQTGQSEEWF